MIKEFPKSLIIAAALLIGGFIIGVALHSCEDSKPIETIIEKHDTILTISKPPIQIDKARTKIKYVTRIIYVDSIQKYTDTVFQPFVLDSYLVTKPFYALLDTIVGKDTIVARFLYPENQFSLFIYYGKDSIDFTWTDTTKIIEKKRTFWNKLEDGALWFLGGFVVGGGIGIAITK